MDDAISNNMKPVYCIYCAESHRSIWNQSHPIYGRTGFQFGCLLAKAQNVPDTTKKLGEIERNCRPWHFLFLPSGFFVGNRVRIPLYGDNVSPHEINFFSLERDQDDRADEQLDVWDFPSISHLNGDLDGDLDHVGVIDTREYDDEFLRSDIGGESGQLRVRLEERGVRRVVVIDVREQAEHEEDEDVITR